MQLLNCSGSGVREAQNHGSNLTSAVHKPKIKPLTNHYLVDPTHKVLEDLSLFNF